LRSNEGSQQSSPGAFDASQQPQLISEREGVSYPSDDDDDANGTQRFVTCLYCKHDDISVGEVFCPMCGHNIIGVEYAGVDEVSGSSAYQ
jgi:hypothetical protein